MHIFLDIFSGQAFKRLIVPGYFPQFVTFSFEGVSFIRIAFVEMGVNENEGNFKIKVKLGLENRLELLGICLSGNSSTLSLLHMDGLEGPKIDDQHHVGPKVAKHFGQHSQSPFERSGKAILVAVDNQEGIHLFDLITQNVHQFIDEFGVIGVFEAWGVHNSDVWSIASPPDQ